MNVDHGRADLIRALRDGTAMVEIAVEQWKSGPKTCITVPDVAVDIAKGRRYGDGWMAYEPYGVWIDGVHDESTCREVLARCIERPYMTTPLTSYYGEPYFWFVAGVREDGRHIPA